MKIALVYQRLISEFLLYQEVLTMYRRRYLLIHSTLQHQEQKHTDRISNRISMPTFKTYKVSSYKSHFTEDIFFKVTASLVNYTKRINTSCSQSLPNNIHGGTIPNSFYEGQNYPDNKIKRELHKKRKLQDNILVNIDRKNS